GILRKLVDRARDSLANTPYPFAQPGVQKTVSGYLRGPEVTTEDLGAVLRDARSHTDLFFELYWRVVGELALLVEQLEARQPAGDILDGMAHSGFRRILIGNGHGGNSAVQPFALEWAAGHPRCRVLFHNWWNAPRTWAKVQAIDPVASHGSWMENFPWTRLPGVGMPDAERPMVDIARVRALDPVALRQYLGDGNFGGRYQRSDDEMLALWRVAVEETRALLTGS